MTAGPDGSYDVVMTVAVGPVKARFKGRMSLADVEPPTRYRLVFEGQSAQAGFARGQTRVELEAVSAQETRLRYTAAAQIGGKLAQIGSRLIDAAAAATADRFFEAFAARLAAAAPPQEGTAPAAGMAAGSLDSAAPAAPAVPAPAPRFGFWRWLASLLKHLFARRTD